MEQPAEVVVVGNAGVDTNAYLSGPLDLARETEYPEVLDTVGQSGGYSARGFARLGRRTAYLGYVGDDALGRFLLDELAADGVDVSHALVDPAGTGRSVNLMSPDGRRHGFYDGKSHLSLVPDLDAWRPALAGARLAHFGIPDWGRRLLGPAREAGAVVSVDLQDVRDLADPYRADFIAAADVLFLSGAQLADPQGRGGRPRPPGPGRGLRAGGARLPGWATTGACAPSARSTWRPPWWTPTAPATRSRSGSSPRTCWRAARSTRPCGAASWRPAGAAPCAAPRAA